MCLTPQCWCTMAREYGISFFVPVLRRMNKAGQTTGPGGQALCFGADFVWVLLATKEGGAVAAATPGRWPTRPAHVVAAGLRICHRCCAS